METLVEMGNIKEFQDHDHTISEEIGEEISGVARGGHGGHRPPPKLLVNVFFSS